MSKSYTWYYVYKAICGKIIPQPSNLSPLERERNLEIRLNSLKPDQETDAGLFDNVEDFQLTKDYPPSGTFAYIRMFFGVRLENFLLDKNYGSIFFKQLVGLKNADETRIIDTQATSLKIHNFKDGARFGYFQALNFDLLPHDPKRTVEPFGTRYHTGTVFDTSLNHEALRQDLINFQFGFGTGGNVKYFIDRNTIKVKRLRKESPDF